MSQQHSRLALRILVVASIFFAFIGMIISLAGDGFLPKELADWKAAQETDDEGAMLVGFLLVSPLIIAAVASLVGLFLAISVLGTMLMLLEPTVESGISAFFTDLDTTLGGVILGIAFFSNALEPDQYS